MVETLRNRIAINALSSAIQVVIAGIVYFFVYRILILKLGVELVGVWSLVVATSSISNIANFGFTSAIIKFVADYNATGDQGSVTRLINTSLASLLVFILIASLIVYIMALLFLGSFIDEMYIDTALEVLPFSLVCLLLSSLGGVFTSALEGYQKNYKRNIIWSAASLCYLAFTALLIPAMGLKGMAVAQILQSLIILLLSAIILRKTIPGFSFEVKHWDREIFRKLFRYGYRIQIISVSQMLVEPVTKIMITTYSGISVLGFYEMASRLIIQLRQVIVNMNQVTIPVVSHYQQTDISGIRYIYQRSLSFIIFVAFPLVAGIILFTPHLSSIWIGKPEEIFMNCSYILAASMMINILCAPAYFNSLGEGRLNIILIMSLSILAMNIGLGVILGALIGRYGVILGLGVSNAAGGMLMMLLYQKASRFHFKDLLERSDYPIIIGTFLFIVLSGFVFIPVIEKQNYSIASLLMFISLYLLYFLPFAYFNRNFRILNFLQFFRKQST